MLSHLVGAANRADIQRLRMLEAENSSLAEKIDRQQQQFRDGFVARDETIRRMNDALARKAGEETAPNSRVAHDDTSALAQALADRDKRLAREAARCARLEDRLGKLTAERDEADRSRERAVRDYEAMRLELESIETRIAVRTPDADEWTADTSVLEWPDIALCRRPRPSDSRSSKSLVERANGQLIHHDGGLEHNPALLPGLVSRADLAVFPVDCVSHDAVAALKRTCRQLGKPYVPLRTSSLDQPVGRDFRDRRADAADRGFRGALTLGPRAYSETPAVGDNLSGIRDEVPDGRNTADSSRRLWSGPGRWAPADPSPGGREDSRLDLASRPLARHVVPARVAPDRRHEPLLPPSGRRSPARRRTRRRRSADGVRRGAHPQIPGDRIRRRRRPPSCNCAILKTSLRARSRSAINKTSIRAATGKR